jgi:hypothetical protein
MTVSDPPGPPDPLVGAELVEPALKRPGIDVGVLGEGGRAVGRTAKQLGERANPHRQRAPQERMHPPCVFGVALVLVDPEPVHARVGAGEHRRMRRNRPARLGDGVLEERALPGDAVEHGAHREGKPVGAQPIGAQGVERDQDDVAPAARARPAPDDRIPEGQARDASASRGPRS